MITKHDCPKLTAYRDRHGHWILRLPDPFSARWHPLDSVTLAELLDVSPRTGQRLCQQPDKLRPCHIGWLQVQIFGMVPDAAFMRLGMFFQGGVLYSRQLPGMAMSAGDFAAWIFQRQMLSGLVGDLAAARSRIDELERLLNPVPVPPSNVIRFPGR